VATRNRPAMLEACLESLAADLEAGDEVLVVDSASNPPLHPALASRFGARLVRLEKPGAARARNVGWRMARNHLIAFVDDDTRVLPGWSDALREALGGPVHFVTGRILAGPGGTPSERPVALIDLDEPFTIHRGRVRDLGHGANLAVHRDRLEEVGGFDESMGPGARWQAAEDLELIDRMLAAGCHGRYVPGASAWHLQWRSRSRLILIEWPYGIGQGARLAKLSRRDRWRALLLAREVLWRGGICDLGTCIRNGYERGAMRAVVRLVATSVGLLACSTATGLGSHVRRKVEGRVVGGSGNHGRDT